MKIKINSPRLFVPIMTFAGIVVVLAAGCAAPDAKMQGKAVQYTCPMHPEVVQAKPGDCPKCGMQLEQKR